MRVNDTREYHLSKPPNLDTEKTFAMIMSLNQGLAKSGLPYGHLLCRELFGKHLRGLRGAIDEPINILEIGPGLGWPSRDFIAALDEEYKQPFRYLAVDIAPNLMKASYLNDLIERGMPVEYVQGDAHSLPDFIEEDSVDILISNEVVGDLLTVADVPSGVLDGTEEPTEHREYVDRLRDIVHRYGLEIYDKNTYNLGALMVVEDMARLLKRKSVAFISEHSCELPRYPGEEPTWTPVARDLTVGEDSHVEYSIRFSDLEKVGEALGFDTVRGQLVDIIDFEEGTWITTRPAINRLLEGGYIQTDKFFSWAVAEHPELFPESIREDPNIADIYLLSRPMLIKDIVGLSQAEFDSVVGPWLAPGTTMAQAMGNFEYIVFSKG